MLIEKWNYLEGNFRFCFLITKFIVADEPVPVFILQML